MIVSDGIIKSPIDTRDIKFEDMVLQIKPNILPKIDMRNIDLPIRNQGLQGSCAGFSTVGAREMLFKQQTGLEIQLSPAFIYYFSRLEAYGKTNEDCGCYLRAVLKAWKKYGCCPEHLFPYDDDIYNQAPNDQAISAAQNFKITEYYSVNSVEAIKAALSLKLPVIIGINSDFILGLPDTNGIVTNPIKVRKVTGLHAVTIVGYYEHPKYPGGGFFVVRNSWGESWGNRGYFYYPYKYINDSRWFEEGWVMKG